MAEKLRVELDERTHLLVPERHPDLLSGVRHLTQEHSDHVAVGRRPASSSVRRAREAVLTQLDTPSA